jgi:hypothetical protein
MARLSDTLAHRIGINHRCYNLDVLDIIMTDNTAPQTAAAAAPTHLKIWDLPLRIFHWALVLLFILAYVTHSLGSDYFEYHAWSGYALIVLEWYGV